MVLLFTILLSIVSYSAYYNYTQKLQLNFSAKIQIYLNFAFFLPLLIVSVATLGIISSDYQEYINENFVEKAKKVRVNIAEILDKYNNQEINNEALNSSLIELAKYSESDINLFNIQGKLIATSQPQIYQSGLNSGLMNPEAFSKIVELKGRVMMIKENIGTLNYNSVYTVIKSPETGEISGVLSIPYFHSKTDLEKHLIEVLNTIIDIFMVVFIFFLVLSYITSRILTDPLNLITQKIKKISFSYENEPLSWNSKDEIGLLVGEYNKMLLKLVESKKILSQTEKESAWREMAQQVAHEIKNPLTPMKLSIQHLQRAMADDRDDIKELLKRSLNNLLSQVDTLSDIATSFSAFAKMPIPINEPFEIGELLLQTVDFYNNLEKGYVKLDKPKEKYMVLSDSQLMGRIISNLILNALQSVPNDRIPQIDIRLSYSDNIKEKVFIPNFSTKYNGSGIGLAVSKRGVEHAGGRIWFETSVELGTSFFIELPVIADEV
jgi:nitrogen fixation/metabolism regulation signal transduction histidine kinase